MRKFAAVFLFVLAGGVFAMAQSTAPLFAIPKNEISFGYAYEHASLNGGFAGTQGLVPETSTGLSGFGLEFSHYLNLLHGNLGYTIDFSRNSSSAVDPTGIGYSNETYTVGPTYRLPRYGFFSSSIHVLAGGSHATFTVPIFGGAKDYFSDSNFAALAGGALDGNLTPHIAIRLAQIDYDYTHHYGANQSSFRYLGGVVFRF
jgi:hypothetical protein